MADAPNPNPADPGATAPPGEPSHEPGLAAALAHLAAAQRGESVPEGQSAEAIAMIDALLAKHQDAVYAMCRRIVGDPERARELAQDALLLAWRKLPEFRGESSFRTWLLGIARFTSIRAVRKRRELLTSDGIVEAGDPGSSVLAQLRRHEREELLRAASASLDAQEQEAVYLRYVEGLPQERITEILALDNETGARGLLQRCRRKLQREILARLAEMGHGRSFLRTSS